MTPQDVLLQARDIIIKHGWVQDYLGGPHDGYCISGALLAVLGCDRALRTEAREAVEFVLDWENIVCYNDAPGRTKKEILGLLEKAAKL